MASFLNVLCYTFGSLHLHVARAGIALPKESPHRKLGSSSKHALAEHEQMYYSRDTFAT